MGGWPKLKHWILIAAFVVSLALYFGALPAGFYNSWHTRRTIPLPNSGLQPYIDGLFAEENSDEVLERGIDQYRTSMLIVGIRSPEIEEKLGDKLSENKHHQAALLQYEQALAQASALDRDHPGLHLKYAESLWHNGRGEEAYRRLQETVERWQDDVLAWYAAGLTSPQLEETLGDKFSLFGHPAEALAQYEKALRIAFEAKTDHAGLHLKYAQSLWNNGQHETAYRHVQETTGRWPDNAEAWFMLASMEQHAGQNAKAIEHCQRALELRENYEAAGKLLTQLQAPGGP